MAGLVAAHAKDVAPMNASTARSYAIWMAVIVVAALLLQGCGDRPFVVRKQQVVGSVNAQGQPGQAASQFTTDDSAAYCWFEYLNAPASKTVKCEVAYTDPDGHTETRAVDLPLKPGRHKVHFGVETPRGEGLRVGSYETQAYDGEIPLFGTPLRFTVAEVPKAAPSPTPVIEPLPAHPSPMDRAPAEREPLAEPKEASAEEGTGGEALAGEQPPADLETSEANLNPFR